MRSGALVALLGWAALATLGLALGAEVQSEAHLAPEDLATLGQNQHQAAGNVVVLTGLLVATGTAGAIAAIAPAWRRRLGAVALVAFGAFVVVNLAQTAYPNLTAVSTAEYRAGQLSVNLLAFQAPGLPGVFVPILALLAGGLLCAGWGAHTLLAPNGPLLHDARTLLVRHAAATSLALPFLAVEGWSLVRLIATPGVPHGLAWVVLSLGALACLALVATPVWKAVHLAAVARDPRLAPVAREAWIGIGRAEQMLAGGLLVVALAGTLLPPTELGLLHPGLTFGVTLRSHVQSLAFLVLPLLPTLLLQPRVVGDLAHRPPGGPRPYLVVAAMGAAGLATLTLAGILTFATQGALWAWAAAFGGAAIAAVPCLRQRHAAATLLVGAFVLWCAGNSHVAIFEAVRGTNLAYARGQGPGVLALLRVGAAVAAGTAIAGMALALSPGRRPSSAVPLATAVGVAVVGIALLEFPLDIWVVTDYRGESAAMGSFIASQEPAVRATMHVVAMALACAMAWCLARLARPGAWGRPPRATHAPAASTAPGPATT